MLCRYRLDCSALVVGLLAGMSFVLLASGPAFGQSVRYVDADATGAGTGTSWADAFPDLQDALAVVQPGDEVWIAEGTYRPTEGSDRTATFTIRSGVALYGGFDGTETSRDERDWTVNETILSGDAGVPGDSTDNAYHVITASGVNATAVLDGFTVERGRGGGAPPPNDRGAGLIAFAGSPTIRNARFRLNHFGPLFGGGERLGGGIYVEGGSPLIEDTVFEDNVGIGAGLYASGGAPVLRRVVFRGNGGGAVSFADGSAGVVEDALFEQNEGPGAFIFASSPVFRRSTFRDNVLPLDGAGTEGAGAYIKEGAPRFEDCLFERLRTNFNLSSGGGGGVYVGAGQQEPSFPVFLRTTFHDNTANTGAAYVEDSHALFLFCHFEGNRALSAAALHLRRSGSAVLASTFVGNHAESQTSGSGGAVSISYHPAVGDGPLVASTLFAGNTARVGGAVALAGTGTLRSTLVNVTLAGNTARVAGGSLWLLDAAGARVENAVLWGNTAPVRPEVYVQDGGGPTVARALIAGGCPVGATCTDVSGADPLFVRAPSAGPDGTWGTSDDDYGDLRVQAGSPALDAGLTSLLPPDVWDLDADGDTTEVLPLDVAGEARVQGEEVDLGAYEGAASTPSVTVSVPSAEGLVIVPSGGGAFEFRVTLTNAGSEAQTVAAGTAVYLPSGTLYGPLFERAVTVPAGSSVVATLRQRVPGSAPAGLYRYVVYTGTYPEALEQTDEFGFLKEATARAPSGAAVSDEAGWRVEVVAVEGEAGEAQAAAPALHAASPNPFGTETTLRYDVVETGHVRLVVYDLLGRSVVVLADAQHEAGRYAAQLDGGSLPAGVYLVRLTAGRYAQTQRVTVLK